jgi:hypothetical protein
MPRQARLDSPKTLHHVIVRGIEKCRIVDNVKEQEDFISGLGGIVKKLKQREGGENGNCLMSGYSASVSLDKINSKKLK